MTSGGCTAGPEQAACLAAIYTRLRAIRSGIELPWHGDLSCHVGPRLLQTSACSSCNRRLRRPAIVGMDVLQSSA